MPPKGTKRALDGSWVPAASVSTVATPQNKKPRTSAASNNARGGVKLTTEDAAHVQHVRTTLNDFVKQLAQAVDDDWHDSYEETGEMLYEWLQACAESVADVHRFVVANGGGFDKCHEVLKTVVDTWSNINAIPFRGCPKDSLSEGEPVEFQVPSHDDASEDMLKVRSPTALVAYVWPMLLARAAADPAVQDTRLLQMIKDAHDHGIKQPEASSKSERFPARLKPVMQAGRQRLQSLVARKNEWSMLPTTVKVHRMRRAIDRRFDGPLHRRTRDPAMFRDMMLGF